jgi:hypothetical protein
MAIQQMMMCASNEPVVLGARYAGGFYVGQISTTADGVATHNLVISDKAEGEILGKKWGPAPANTYVSGVIDGPTQSAYLASIGTTYEAATFCETLTSGGYSDWYLPALYELEVLYYFLKPVDSSTSPNSTFYGANPYAVDPEFININYTSGRPLGRPPTIFQLGGSQALTEGRYWVCSENPTDPSYTGRYISFFNGAVGGTLKNTTTSYTRAIRRVPV